MMTGSTTFLLEEETIETEDDEGSSSRYFSKKIVVAIAQNPPTGRPTATVFKFSVKDKDVDGTLCNDYFSLNFDGKTEKKKEIDADKEATEELQSCQATLTISNKGCTPRVMSWTGKEFKIEKTLDKKNSEKK